MKPSSPVVLNPGRAQRSAFVLRVGASAAWLTRPEIADLFGTSTANIHPHIRHFLKERELLEGAVVEESLIPAAEGRNNRTNVEWILEFNERSTHRGAERPAAAPENLRALREKSGELQAQKGPQGADVNDDLGRIIARFAKVGMPRNIKEQKV